MAKRKSRSLVPKSKEKKVEAKKCAKSSTVVKKENKILNENKDNKEKKCTSSKIIGC